MIRTCFVDVRSMDHCKRHCTLRIFTSRMHTTGNFVRWSHHRNGTITTDTRHCGILIDFSFCPPSNVTVTFQKKFYVRDLFVWSIRTHPYAQIVRSISGSASTRHRWWEIKSPDPHVFFLQQTEPKRLRNAITITFEG